MLIWYYIFIFWTCASIWCRNNQATLPSWPSSILGSPRPKRWETFFPPWKDLVLRVSIHFLLHNRHEIALVGHHGSFGWGVAMFHNVSPRRHHQNHVTRSEDESGFYSTQCCWSQNWHFHGFPLNFHWISTDFHGFPLNFHWFPGFPFWDQHRCGAPPAPCRPTTAGSPPEASQPSRQWSQDWSYLKRWDRWDLKPWRPWMPWMPWRLWRLWSWTRVDSLNVHT